MDFILEGLQAFALLSSNIWGVFQYLWFLVLPPLLYFIFKVIWEDHVSDQYAEKLRYTLLEIIPPRDIEKSPLPMELFFETLASTDKGMSVKDEFITGEFFPRFSCEVASDGGAVHFYIRTETRFRNIVEAALYAQYPDVEILEVPDYVNQVPAGIPNADFDLWGTDFDYTRDDIYPIRTYRSFQEDVTGKMVDPLAHLVEIMGKVPPGHHVWFQCHFTAVRPNWYKDAKKKVNVLMATMAKEKGVSSDDGSALEMQLTPVEKKVLEAVENNIGKNMFRVRLRFVYIAPAKALDRASFISGFVGVIKQFNDSNLNGLKPNDESKTYANYAFTKERLRYRQRRILRRYKRRDPTPIGTTVVMSSTELATLFHMPDMSVLAPALLRTGSKRGSAPVNLPVE